MFSRNPTPPSPRRNPRWTRSARWHGQIIEPLEDRSLLSAVHPAFHPAALGARGGSFNTSAPVRGAIASQTITFSQAPSAVQSGLTSLAASDSLGTPTATQTVFLGNTNGIETYTIDLGSTGTHSLLTVDQNGAAVTQPGKTTTTFGAISNTAVTNEITAIASALSLTAPTSTTSVTVITPASGPAIYSIALTSGTTTTTGKTARATIISVDAIGNPAGNEIVPLSTLSAGIQNGLTSHAPAGAAALSSTSSITVRTLNGVTTYTATFTATGTRTSITVNAAGDLTSLPSTNTIQYSTLPAAASSALQTLATAKGYTGTIAATQSVLAYDEANGTVIYSVKLPVTTTTASGTTYTYLITLTVDQNGNPTVLPGLQPFGGGPGLCL